MTDEVVGMEVLVQLDRLYIRFAMFLVGRARTQAGTVALTPCWVP